MTNYSKCKNPGPLHVVMNKVLWTQALSFFTHCRWILYITMWNLSSFTRDPVDCKALLFFLWMPIQKKTKKMKNIFAEPLCPTEVFGLNIYGPKNVGKKSSHFSFLYSVDFALKDLLTYLLLIFPHVGRTCYLVNNIHWHMLFNQMELIHQPPR